MATDANDKSGQNGQDGSDNKDSNTKKFSFDEDEQKFIQTLIDKSVARVHDKYKTQIDTLTTELSTIKTASENKDDKGGNKDDKGGDKDFNKAQARELIDAEQRKAKAAEEAAKAAKKDADDARAEAQRVRKEVAMSKAASKQNFYELETVLALTDRHVEFNSELKQFVIKDEAGNIRQNSSMEPMTLDEFYLDFASKRPYLVNGDIKSGAGSHQNNGGNNGLGLVKTKADLKTNKEKSEYISKFGLDKYEALPLK